MVEPVAECQVLEAIGKQDAHNALIEAVAKCQVFLALTFHGANGNGLEISGFESQVAKGEICSATSAKQPIHLQYIVMDLIRTRDKSLNRS